MIPFDERYVEAAPIRTRGSYQILSARRADSGLRCVIVLSTAGAEGGLSEVERAHGLIDHPQVPKVVYRGTAQGSPFVELSCEAVADGLDVARLLASSQRKIPYGAADAFIAGLRKAMQAAHRVIDPQTGGPLCLGRLSLANLLIDEAGNAFLLGFGRNFPIENEDGTPAADIAYFQAPELATGAKASPMGDYVALVLFMRSLMPYVDLSGHIGRILRGEIYPADAEFISCLRWVDQRVLGEVPAMRATMEEAVEVADRIRAFIGDELDSDGFAAHIAALLSEQTAPSPRPDAGESNDALTLRMSRDAAWIAGADGERRRLGRAQRRILLALVQHRAQNPDVPLSMWDLLEAGWPGEKPLQNAGANRVYVAVARLRGLGLRDIIERFEDGYRLAPKAVVRSEE